MSPFRFLSLSALPESEDQQKLLDFAILYKKPTGEGAAAAVKNWGKFLLSFTESCLGEETLKKVQLKHGMVPIREYYPGGKGNKIREREVFLGNSSGIFLFLKSF